MGHERGMERGGDRQPLRGHLVLRAPGEKIVDRGAAAADNHLLRGVEVADNETLVVGEKIPHPGLRRLDDGHAPWILAVALLRRHGPGTGTDQPEQVLVGEAPRRPQRG